MHAPAYSAIDRLAQRLAFAHPAVQDILADIEAQLYGRSWRGQPLTRPIFVTSLPRAGTTLLLEVLARLPRVATHSYRDMPFVRAPILWSRLSRRFRKSQAAAERAHGDGMMISPDSPEAFEETVWLARFPEHYRPDGIALWPERDAGFAAALTDHMRRIIALRMGGVAPDARYISKNNANIARIGLLRSAFPDAAILVPLRDPLAQARSMHRQHLRFAERHAEDDFARRYMADIGHFEFGAVHRPILFDGVRELAKRHRPDQLEYWIGYWTAACRHLAAQDGVRFLDHAGFCENGSGNFPRLCAALGLAVADAACAAAAAQIRPVAEQVPAGEEIAGLAAAREVFAELRARSLFGP